MTYVSPLHLSASGRHVKLGVRGHASSVLQGLSFSSLGSRVRARGGRGSCAPCTASDSRAAHSYSAAAAAPRPDPASPAPGGNRSRRRAAGPRSAHLARLRQYRRRRPRPEPRAGRGASGRRRRVLPAHRPAAPTCVSVTIKPSLDSQQVRKHNFPHASSIRCLKGELSNHDSCWQHAAYDLQCDDRHHSRRVYCTQRQCLAT